jgi:hypothetical protein
MKRNILAATAALLMGTTAQAEDHYTELARKGAWTAFYTVGNKNIPLCALRTRWRDGRMFYLKSEPGRLLLQAFKPTWRTPQDTEVKVYIAFDGEQFPATAMATLLVPEGGYLTFYVTPGTEDHFLGKWTAAKQVTVGFPDGNEKPWVADVTGSLEVTDAFKKCAAQLTQPHNTKPKPATTAPPTWGM